MSVAHPWLEEKVWPTKPLPKEELERRIERCITLTNLGYLGTTRKDGSPIVSPLEFYHDGMSLYFFPQPNSPKHWAIKRDPRVSLAIANSMAGWACVMGAQFFGKATLLDPDTPEWEHGMKIFKWVASSFELWGTVADGPPKGQLARLDPDRIVYTEHLLRKDGFAPRQIWHKDQDEVETVQGRQDGN